MHRSAARNWEEQELLSVLPHNIELEQALLGGLLISNASYHHVSPLVRPANYYERLHGRLFEAIAISLPRIRPLRPSRLCLFLKARWLDLSRFSNISDTSSPRP